MLIREEGVTFQRIKTWKTSKDPRQAKKARVEHLYAIRRSIPSATRNSASFDRLQAENGRSCPAGFDLATFLISRRWPKANFGGRPPLYLGYSEPNPSALKSRITSRTRSSLVNATFAIAATFMPCADSSTICARRQVTTDPLPRRTIRARRCPAPALKGAHPSKPARANVTCYGTSKSLSPTLFCIQNL